MGSPAKEKEFMRRIALIALLLSGGLGGQHGFAQNGSTANLHGTVRKRHDDRPGQCRRFPEFRQVQVGLKLGW
jgi:hypothetical protein